MHKPIRDGLEDFLSGAEEAGRLGEFERHLASCQECRSTVEQVRSQCKLLRSLRSPAGVEPATGFYARVRQRIESQARASIWNVFLEPAFAKRIAYASLTLLLLFGALMVSLENEPFPTASSPEVILAEESPPPTLGEDQQRDRDAILVTLATYEE